MCVEYAKVPMQIEENYKNLVTKKLLDLKSRSF